jgi:hypothetical protein
LDKKAVTVLGVVAVVAILVSLGAVYAAGGQQVGPAAGFGWTTGGAGNRGSMMGGQHYSGGMMGGYYGSLSQAGDMFSWCYARMQGYLNSAFAGP